MDILEWDDFIAPGRGPEGESLAITIGVFDGVHRGHQALLKQITSGPFLPAALTFRQNPMRSLRPQNYPGDISSLEQKLKMLEYLGVRQTVLIDFSEDFSKIKGRDFVDLLKRNGRVKYFALGRNFRCGYRLDTGVPEIKEMTRSEGIETEALEPVMEGGRPVSSSRIRAAIAAGDLAAAAALLGRNVRIDLRGLPAADTGGGFRYDAASAFRITPHPGTYRVLVYGAVPGGNRETEISINDGKIFIPGKPGEPAGAAESVEFIEQASGNGKPDAGESE
jgi:riboflavin kinase/FMN adenylyltransferase